MSSLGKIWMVRIGDHVRGPFETEAVKSLILAQKISEIDEIALPCKSWGYIRDRAEFIKTFQSLKSSSFGRVGSDHTSLTGTENLSEFTTSKTEELTFSKQMDTKTTPLSDFQDIDLRKETLDLEKLKNKKAARVPAHQKSKSKLRFVVFAVFLIFGGLNYYFTNNLGYSPLALLKNDFAVKFKTNWESGNFEKALKQMQGDKSLINEHTIEYVALLLIQNSDFRSVEQALNEVEDKTSADWKNLSGLLEFKKNNFDSAESFFLGALESQPNHIPSLVNLGLLKRRDRDWESARYYFESAYSSAPSELGQEEISFYLVESWLNQIRKKDGLTQVEEVRAFLKNRLIGNSTFYHELSLIDMWINTLKRSWDEAENDVLKSFISLDPYILKERKTNPYFHKIAEGELSYICDDLAVKLKNSNYKPSALALCSVVDKKLNKALGYLKGPSKEFDLSMMSFIYRLKKDDLKAQENLVLALEQTKNESIVKFFLQARFCFDKGDMKCAAEYWRKALDFDSEAYTAHTGLSRAYYEARDYKRAQKFMERAEVFTQSYGPLIELQALMQNVQ